jgi:hypothetical protein
MNEHTIDTIINAADAMPDEGPWIDRVSVAACRLGMAVWHDGEAFTEATGIGEAYGFSPAAHEVAS